MTSQVAEALTRRSLFRRSPLLLDPQFTAEAVRAGIARGGEVAAGYHREAEAIYRLSVRDRERAFCELDAKYLEVLGIQARLRAAISPFERLLGERRLLLVRAADASDEGAELYRIEGAQAVRLAVQLERLWDDAGLSRLVAHELAHVEDMLDPAFAYDCGRALPGHSRTERDLSRERFRVLWGASIDGRLAAQGALPLLPLAQWQELGRRAFPRARPEAVDAELTALWSAPRPTHAQLLARCGQVDLGAPVKAGPTAGQSCPLCHFTTFEWAPAEELERAQPSISRDFPRWTADQGACAQCLTCYLPSFASPRRVP